MLTSRSARRGGLHRHFSGSTYSSDSHCTFSGTDGDSTVTLPPLLQRCRRHHPGPVPSGRQRRNANSYALVSRLRLDPMSLKALNDLRGQVLPAI